MVVKNEKEIGFLALLLKWQNDSSEDRHQIQDGLSSKRNTQTTRLVYALNIMVLHNEDFDSIFQQLEKHTRREKDSNSYFSKDSSWMKEPKCVKENWFFEGCTSLKQKQYCIQNVTKIRFPSGFSFSARFADCLADFIGNLSLEKYTPTKNDSESYDLFRENTEKLQSIDFTALLPILT